jgi:hypothetical protein
VNGSVDGDPGEALKRARARGFRDTGAPGTDDTTGGPTDDEPDTTSDVTDETDETEGEQ